MSIRAIIVSLLIAAVASIALVMFWPSFFGGGSGSGGGSTTPDGSGLGAIVEPASYDAVDQKAARILRDLVSTTRSAAEPVAARRTLACAYQINGLKEEALATWQQIIDAGAADADVWYYVALLQHESGDIEDAIAAMESSLDADDTAVARTRLGFWHLERGRAEDARAAFRRAIELDPSSVNARIGMARLDLESGASDAAAERLTALRAEEPADAYVRYLLGTALRSSNPERAQIELTAGAGSSLTWANRDPHLAQLQQYWVGYRADFARAQWHIRNGQLDEAEPYVTSLLTEKPGDPAVSSLWGVALMNAGRLDEAITVMKAGLATEDHFGLHTNIAVAYERNAQFEEAYHHIERAVALRSDLPVALTAKGRILVSAKRPRFAIEPLQASIAAEPRDPEPYVLLGTALLQTRQPEPAAEHLRTATERFPGQIRLWQLLASAEYQLNRFDAALAAMEEAARRAPNNASIRESLESMRTAIENATAPSGDG